MTSLGTHLPETNGGIVTSWIPLTSAWPSVAECVTGGIYSQLGDQGVAIADDPYYGVNLDNTLTCLPPIATLWWTQTSTLPLATHTSFGPIVCPEGYTTAVTSAVNDASTFVGCCPSDYAFGSIKEPGTIGQCNSPLSVGQLLTYIDLNPSPHEATVTISTEGASVYAVHLNGVNFAASSTSTSFTTSSSSLSTSSSSTIPSSTANTQLTVSATPSKSPSTSGLSSGAKTGIGIGVSLGVVGLGALSAALFLVLRYRKKAKASQLTSDGDGSSVPLPTWTHKDYYGSEAGRMESFGSPKPNIDVAPARSEMEQPSSLFELPSTPR